MVLRAQKIFNNKDQQREQATDNECVIIFETNLIA